MEIQSKYFNSTFVPLDTPLKMNGPKFSKLSFKVCIKKEFTREDGTNALYLSIYYNKKRKKIPLNISVPTKYFDTKKQRIKKTYKYSSDFNLIIEKMLGDLNNIEVSYRLNNESITIEKVVQDLMSPSLRINFNVFAQSFLETQLKEQIIKSSTYRQQKASLKKIEKYQNPLLFSEINIEFLKKYRAYLKNTLKNKPATIEGSIKNFKKFLHAANNRGIKTDLKFNDVKVSSMLGDFTFLLPSELKKLHEFYNYEFINTSWKNILQRYLFSCFTGLRIGDIESISEENFIDDYLVFSFQKTGKISRQKLNSTAMNLIDFPNVFASNYTREHINRELKNIAKVCGIKKRLYFHSSRHTFATNYLIAGGQVQNLQRLLGHSKIETTMIYVHVAESIADQEIHLMDSIIK